MKVYKDIYYEDIKTILHFHFLNKIKRLYLYYTSIVLYCYVQREAKY